MHVFLKTIFSYQMLTISHMDISLKYVDKLKLFLQKVMNHPIYQLKKINQRYDGKQLTNNQYNEIVTKIIDLKKQKPIEKQDIVKKRS